MTCTWCGHPPHETGCPRTIRATNPDDRKTTIDVPCPCAKKGHQ